MLYITILFIAFLTALTRFLPFFIFRNKTPKVITDLGTLLPPSLIAMIFIYSCKDMLQLDNIELGIYGLVGIVFVLFLHIVFKNILFSIFCGTLFYLVLRNHDLIFDTISF
ncbi:branched-chain amino acid transporter permease [Helicobacter trogontum]|uniref:Branched-chain amino acid ABC transporter n=1 Tax=Helicobacter trogontum TaxID=50960 RepID=A0A4U8SF69_9HELI|nr:AzlD domain-containing protein [Helicobacter trogontum]TLD84856.1 hypothetical protein LS81_000290 [Helicobacter trogontum]